MRARSSVGEHCVDIAGVAGSIPAVPTIEALRDNLRASTRSMWCNISIEIFDLYYSNLTYEKDCVVKIQTFRAKIDDGRVSEPTAMVSPGPKHLNWCFL